MSSLLVDTMDLDLANEIEQSQGPGLYEIRVRLADFISSEEIDKLSQALLDAGVDLKSVTLIEGEDLPYISIVYQKYEPTTRLSAFPVAIIPLLTTALVVGVIAVAIFNLESITKTVLAVGAVLFLLALALKQPLTEAARRL